ncbi:MAG: hypothetical protein WCA27_30115 [Candidatus Sulfotelmatobacter sp.]
MSSLPPAKNPPTPRLPRVDLTDEECRRYEARADEIERTEPIEVLFAVAANLGFVDGLGGSEYRSWARDQVLPAALKEFPNIRLRNLTRQVLKEIRTALPLDFPD